MKPEDVKVGMRVTIVNASFLTSEEEIGLHGVVVKEPDEQNDVYAKFERPGDKQIHLWIECENVEPEGYTLGMKAEDIHVGEFVILARKGGRYMKEKYLGAMFRISAEVSVTGSCIAFNPDIDNGWEFFLTPDMLDPVNDVQITNCLLNEKKWSQQTC